MPIHSSTSSDVYSLAGHLGNLPSHSAAVDAGLYPLKFPINAVPVTRKLAPAAIEVHDVPTDSSAETLRETAGGHLPHFEDDFNSNSRGCATPPNFYSSEPTLLKTHANVLDLPPAEHEHASKCSSVLSDHSYNNSELTSFRGGSTTQLVPSAGATSKLGLGSNVTGSSNMSFVEGSPNTSVYSSTTSQVGARLKLLFATLKYMHPYMYTYMFNLCFSNPKLGKTRQIQTVLASSSTTE